MPKVLSARVPSRPVRPATGPALSPRPATSAVGPVSGRLPAMAVASAVEISPEIIRRPPALARRTPIDMDLPGEASPSRLGALFANTRWQKTRRLMVRGAAAAMVLLIIFGGLLFSQVYMKVHKVFNGTGTASALNDTNLLKGEKSGRVNILLLGRGGANHDGPDLTDSMMLASIDVINHKATLISLPRDLWVNVPGQGVMKLNAVWETGEFQYLGKERPGSTDPKAIQAGYDLVDQTIQSVTGVNVDYNMIVNFQAFQQAVDAVNGVTVDVPSDLVDPTMAWQNNNNPVLAKAGVRHFSGYKALLYVRSRETTSDFARAQRQRAVLVALKSKVVSLGTLSNPAKILKLINSFGDNVSTDLSFSNAQRLYKLTKGISASNVDSVGLDNGDNPYVTTGNINGQSVVLPKAGLFNYGAIKKFIGTKLPNPLTVKENASILVLNGTQLPDLAAHKAAQLKSYGYNVTQVGNAPSTDWTKTVLVDMTHGRDKYTRSSLEQRLGLAASNDMPDGTIQTNGADFVIIIGSDEVPTTQSQAN